MDQRELEKLWETQRGLMGRLMQSMLPMYAGKLHELDGISKLTDCTAACATGDIQQAVDLLGPTFASTMLHYMLVRLTYEASKIEQGQSQRN